MPYSIWELVIIGSGYGLSSVQHQAILTNCELDPNEQTSVKS